MTAPHERPEFTEQVTDTGAGGAPRGTAERHAEKAAGRGTNPASAGQRHVDAAVPADVLAAVERQLALVDQRLHEAIGDSQALGRIHAEATDPQTAGAAAGHRTLAQARWSEAIGARAQLEALYQQLAGRPSPSHAAATEILRDHGVAPNPVGLEGRDPHTAAFLREHDATADTPTRTRHVTPCQHDELDHGLDR